MTNNLILEIKNKNNTLKNYQIEISSDNLEHQDQFELIELLEDKIVQVGLNIVPNNEDNYIFNEKDEGNSKKRNNSCDPKKVHDIDDYFLKNVNLLDWLYNNMDISVKINKEILVLLKQIFDKRYKLYPNNVCSLSEYSSHIKNKVDIYCSEDNNMSIYILHVLYNKFFDFFKYMEEVINFEKMNSDDFKCFKEIIYLIGKDIKTIFKNAVNTIDKFNNFKFANVLIIMFNEFLNQNNKIKKSKIDHAALIAERKIFEDYIKDIDKIKYTSNLTKWATDPSDFNIENQIIEKYEDNKNNESCKNNISQNDENKNFNNRENNQFTELEQRKEIKISSNDSNYYGKNGNENDNDNNFLTTEKEHDNNDVDKLNIEDLVSYINEPKAKANHKKKPKKKKKSKKTNKENKENNENINVNNNTKETSNENNNTNEDLVIADFKKCLEEFNTRRNNYLYPKKIMPNISGSFLNKMRMYYE